MFLRAFWTSMAERFIKLLITSMQKYGRPVLGFNCVGGKSATNLMKQLA